MPRVNLEITGFFYRREVLVPDGAATVKEVMDAAEALTNFPKLVVIPEAAGGFLNTLIVFHAGNTASSGQTRAGTPVGRIYPDGVYVGEDDKVSFSPNEQNPILVSEDGLVQVRAWQYYVYDASFVDLNRKARSRRIVPYTSPFPSAEAPRPFEDDDTVVWRQVTISVAPTFCTKSSGPKTAIAEAKP